MTKDNEAENNVKLLYFEFSKMKYLSNGKSVEIEGTYPVYVSEGVNADLDAAIEQFSAYKCRLGLKLLQPQIEEEDGTLSWLCQGGKATAHIEIRAEDSIIVQQLQAQLAAAIQKGPKDTVAFLSEHGLLSEVF